MTAILITMPHSHYAEKARWALDRVALPYREEPHVPLFHRLATGRHGGGDLLYPREPALRGEATVLSVTMPVVLNRIRSRLRITPESAQRSLERVRGIFREVDERLADGRRQLVGDRFTAADLTFAALAAPVLFPAGNRAAYLALDEAPAAMREEVLRLCDAAVGRFGVRLFAQERVGAS